ncbi:lytic transglycosylase domain-containing protein [Hafnia paralvei]|uniref:lytic transglycosylase domain-containing protein n=1 Tax=Hafnia paralvei TaxID=546367 RepID=UPI002FDBB45E
MSFQKCIRVLKSAIYVIFIYAGSANAFCFNEAGALYQIDPVLLRSLAIRESSLNPKAINSNKNKEGKVTSYDYGLMQINSTHISELKSLGVIKSKDDLLDKPCLNVQVGAWILAKHLQKCGVNWDCLGSYNAGFSDKNALVRMFYAKKIYAIYQKELRGG